MSATAVAETFHVYPYNANGDCDEPFERFANALKPGDELIVHDGTYSQSCARQISVRGTPEQPIVIRAAPGATPTLTRPENNRHTQNNLEIVDSAFVMIRGLRFYGGSLGVRFVGGHDIVFEHNEISATDSAAITINSGDATRLILRHNHIHHTGRATDAPTTGEGIYVGCNNATCKVTDSVFEHNHIHDLRATSDGGNDGIEIKPGSGGNLIQYNRIHDTQDGRAYPCILVYGGGEQPNLVLHNVVQRCGEAIQVIADAVVAHNTISDSSIAGIVSTPHKQVGAPGNLIILNNQVRNHPMCLQLDWRKATDVTLRDNQFLCSDSTAVQSRGLGNGNIIDNVFSGRSNEAHEGLHEHR
ncbi:MAG: right-handed parallel beta-helix repeat-containing protein [Gammaproteobacteria bacterium]